MPAGTVCHRCRRPYSLPGRCPRCVPQARTAPRQLRATYAWRRLSEAARAPGVCTSCKRRALPAQLEADHIIPASVRPDLALDPGNVRALCRPCHYRRKRQY